jgi:uncharacterized membrane protein
MRKTYPLTTSIIISAIALCALTIIGFNIFASNPQTQQQPSSWMLQMSGGMMGQNQMTQANPNTATLYSWALFAAIAAITIVGVIGLIRYVAYPHTKLGMAKQVNVQMVKQTTASNVSAYASVEKTLTEEERQVISTLSAHQGKYLQKYITKETGLSKLKTHRIVSRLADRGIVSLEKTGNTNQVYLASWLKQQE